MDSRPAGVLRLGVRAFGPEELLIMAVVNGASEPAAAMARVHEAVAEGAHIVEVPVGPDVESERAVRFIAAVREAYPELIVGVSTGRHEVALQACAAGADLLRGVDLQGGGDLLDGVDLQGGDFGVAAEFGAGVVCPAALASGAAAAGVPVERIVIEAENTGELAELIATGRPVLVSPVTGDLARSLATAAVAAWLGARVFRVAEVRAARRALRMTSAIRGDIPPAYAVRGLALGLG
jgi:dihydropteroate synthase